MTMLARAWGFFVPYRTHHLPRTPFRFIATMGAKATATVDTTKRVEALRELMRRKEYDVTAYVVPSEDQRAYSFLMPGWRC